MTELSNVDTTDAGDRPVQLGRPASAPQDRGPFDGGVALISPCGWGNLGDAAILESVIGAVKARLPQVPIVGFTMRPDDTTRRHGIPAYSLSGFSRSYYGVVTDADEGDQAAAETPPTRRARLFGLPGVRDLITAGRLARAERAYRRRVNDLSEGLSHVVIAGGGQFDDFWGGTLGHPYVLSSWGRRAGRIGASFDILSVGTGTIRSALSRRLMHDAYRRADVASFRDTESRELLGGPAADAPVVPDLAYGLAVDVPDRSPSARPVVGFSPIAYADPRVWPLPDPERYASYLDRLTRLCEQLVDRGFDLVMFATDGCDNATIEDLVESLKTSGSQRMAHVTVSGLASVEGLLDCLGEVDVVVVSRLHGAIVSHVASRPVVALSYERKVATVMKEFGHERFCVEIETFDPEATASLVETMMDERSDAVLSIQTAVAERRRQVERQFDEVFGRVSAEVGMGQ